MYQDSSLSASHLTKKSFLDKYNSISKTIKTNSSCYAISTEWWVFFESLLSSNPSDLDLPMENPGPINNLPLLKLSEIYTELVHINEDTGYPSSVDGQVLAEMSDWDNMTLKPNLKYRTDFVIISGFLWKFLQERFQGGPEIELLPEPKLEGHFFRGITPEEEPALDKNVVVNTDLIKVYVTKDQEFESAAARYISPTITVQSLLNCLCKDFYLPPHKAALHHKIGDTKVIELKDKKATLLSQNIHEGSFLSISRGVEPLLGFSTTTRNQESMWDREERIENSTDNEDEGRRQQLTQDSDFEGNYSTHSRNSTDSARLSTGSTNPHLNPLDFSEYMFGDEVPGGNNNQNRDFMDIKDFGFDNINPNGKQDIPDLKDQSYPTLELFLKRSRQSTEKQKINYQFKSLLEIKANLIQIQREWNLCTKSNLNKKA